MRPLPLAVVADVALVAGGSVDDEVDEDSNGNARLLSVGLLRGGGAARLVEIG
jgi:hypothetical protein